MSTTTTQREPELLGQTVVVIGGSSGIGLETARRARAEGARVIVTGRDAGRLQQAAKELDAKTSAFDATDPAALEQFFRELPTSFNHLLMTAGRPYYAPLVEMDFEEVRHVVDSDLLLPLRLARLAIGKVKPGGTLVFVGGTGARRPAVGLSVISALSVGMPALVANLAVELAPIRVNVVSPGWVDTPIWETLAGDAKSERLAAMAARLPARRVGTPADLAAAYAAVLDNGFVTGTVVHVDGGHRLV